MPVYEQNLLEHGNIIEGPAIIEAADTTTVLEPGWNLSVDKYLNLIIERIEEEGRTYELPHTNRYSVLALFYWQRRGWPIQQ